MSAYDERAVCGCCPPLDRCSDAPTKWTLTTLAECCGRLATPFPIPQCFHNTQRLCAPRQLIQRPRVCTAATASEGSAATLLSTNRQLRACASALIHHLTIEFRLNHAFDPSCDAASMAQGEAALARFGQQQLACFPRLAVLRSLRLVNACKSIFHGHAALMLNAHAGACSALQQLTILTLDNFVSASIAAHPASLLLLLAAAPYAPAQAPARQTTPQAAI